MIPAAIASLVGPAVRALTGGGAASGPASSGGGVVSNLVQNLPGAMLSTAGKVVSSILGR
ncbi:hypothetical protein [Roseateles sp. MS654]|uniref:hypothetical protein n=1 Tax=Roseateles sp. MS654 TaxID=3412685 RepID=UPI003C2C1F67